MKKPAKTPRKGAYITIPDWMVRCYNLTGTKLLVYAIIHGFSQDGESCFKGSSSYLMYWTGVSKTKVLSVLRELVEEKLICKEEIPYTRINPDRHYCNYYTVFSRFSDYKKQQIISQC